MDRPDFSKANWRKASVSGDGACVEVGHADGRIGVRDTKDSGRGPVLVFDEKEWRAFVVGVRSGEFEFDELAK